MYQKLVIKIYDLILYITAFVKRYDPLVKRVLIIRVDEIGDYVLWRKFLFEINSCAKLSGHELHFIGNMAWRSLFDLEFKGAFKKVYWLDKKKFKRSLFYRFKLLKNIKKESYSIVINPTFSRDPFFDDTIVMAAKCNECYGFEKNFENYRSFNKDFDKHLYNHIHRTSAEPQFEFFRNKAFTEWFIKEKSITKNILFPKHDKPLLKGLPPDYFIVFPGSRSKKRIWSSDNFLEVANYLFNEYNLVAVICGSSTDHQYVKNFLDKYTHPYLDLSGKTTLPQMLNVLRFAKCIITVDTGSVHLAAAVNCPVYGIFNGSQYGRFSPYPTSLCEIVHSFYPDIVLTDLKNGKLNNYQFKVDVPYDLVSPKLVIDYLAKHI